MANLMVEDASQRGDGDFLDLNASFGGIDVDEEPDAAPPEQADPEPEAKPDEAQVAREREIMSRLAEAPKQIGEPPAPPRFDDIDIGIDPDGDLTGLTGADLRQALERRDAEVARRRDEYERQRADYQRRVDEVRQGAAASVTAIVEARVPGLSQHGWALEAASHAVQRDPRMAALTNDQRFQASLDLAAAMVRAQESRVPNHGAGRTTTARGEPVGPTGPRPTGRRGEWMDPRAQRSMIGEIMDDL